ncbi:SDR family NAD(P)-dependent oxidoreductase [Nocardioides sp. NPDC006273]|uniref:SDR family NAD(P)-dependent oxidoreductase n=1 Tax=Nocardioides sp. NPDC006273 TaxID=3155598 RepID=UPI0033A39670
MNVAGKVAVITGAGRGIGAALAAGLAEHGARVVVADLDPETTGQVAAAVGGVAVVGDASQTSVLEEMVAVAESNFGPVDLFFANAGIAGEAGIGESDDEWRRILDIWPGSSEPCLPRGGRWCDGAPCLGGRRRSRPVGQTRGTDLQEARDATWPLRKGEGLR